MAEEVDPDLRPGGVNAPHEIPINQMGWFILRALAPHPLPGMVRAYPAAALGHGSGPDPKALEKRPASKLDLQTQHVRRHRILGARQTPGGLTIGC